MIVPVAIGMLTTFTFQLADTYFIGKLGTRELAAVSFAYPVYFLIVSLFIGVSSGVSSSVGKAIGENNTKKAKTLVTVSQLFFMLITLIIGIAGYFSTKPVFSLLGASADNLLIVTNYMEIIYLGMFALVGTLIGNSALMAKGIMIESTLVMIIGGVVNLVLDYLFIFGSGQIPAMGLKGAALATVISWGITLFLMNGLLIKENLLSFASFNSVKEIIKGIKEILTIGMPAVAAQILNPIAIAVITRMVANYGDRTVAAYGIVTKIESLGLTGILSLSAILTPVVAQNFGAKIQHRLDEILVYSWKITVYWCVILYIILFFFSGMIGSVFNDHPEIIQNIKYYFLIVGISFPWFGLALIRASFFNGVYQPKESLRLTLIKSMALTIPLVIIGSFIGITGIWMGLAISNIASAIYADKLLTSWLIKNNSSLPGHSRLSFFIDDFKKLKNRLI